MIFGCICSFQWTKVTPCRKTDKYEGTLDDLANTQLELIGWFQRFSLNWPSICWSFGCRRGAHWPKDCLRETTSTHLRNSWNPWPKWSRGRWILARFRLQLTIKLLSCYHGFWMGVYRIPYTVYHLTSAALLSTSWNHLIRHLGPIGLEHATYK